MEHVQDNCNGTQTAFFDGTKDVLCGDYDVAVDFTLTSWPLLPTGDRYSSLGVFNALGGHASVVERYRRYAPYGCWPHDDTYKFWSGDSDNCVATYVESSDLNGRFRIKREGTTLREYFWDGLDWLEQLTATTDVAPAAVELYSAAVNGLLVGHEVHFDNLIILSGASASGGTPTGGEVSDLTVTRTSSGDLTLAWGASCAPGDDDYEVYEGQIGDFTSHSPRFCSTAGLTTETVTPQAGDSYYLVVPRNSSREGSYGRSSDGSRRVQGVNACLPQETGGCP